MSDRNRILLCAGFLLAGFLTLAPPVRDAIKVEVSFHSMDGDERQLLLSATRSDDGSGAYSLQLCDSLQIRDYTSLLWMSKGRLSRPQEAELLDSPEELSGEDVLPGFVSEIKDIL